MKIRISFGLILRILQALVLSAALAYITYLELPKGDHKALVLGCVGIVAVGGVIDPLVRAIANEFGELSFETRLKVEQPLMALIDALDKNSGVLSFRDVGVTVFVLRRTRRHPIAGIQVRIVRMRFRANPRPTMIQWTKHKGVLGQCWDDLKVRGLDHRPMFRKYEGYNKKQWRKVPQKVRQKLTLKDMKAIADYGYVEAHPIIDQRGRYKGCLVVQVESKYQRVMEQPEIRALVEIAAATVGDVLGG